VWLGHGSAAIQIQTCARRCIANLFIVTHDTPCPLDMMFDRFRRHDNEQNVELQGLNKRAGATANEMDGDRASFEHVHDNGNDRNRGLFWQWLFEILSLFGALLVLCAIVGLLVGYHDNKQPVWKYSINLNSLVALLSTLFKALMMVAVAEGTPSHLHVVSIWTSQIQPPVHTLISGSDKSMQMDVVPEAARSRSVSDL
jgi:hypothetical protein